MIEEAPVFRRQYSLDHDARYFIQWHGVIVENAALSDFITEPVLQGDAELAGLAPVITGLLECGYGEGEEHHTTASTKGHSFRQKFDDYRLEADGSKAGTEIGIGATGILSPLPHIVETGVDKRIQRQPVDKAVLDTFFSKPVLQGSCSALLARLGEAGIRRPRIYPNSLACFARPI